MWENDPDHVGYIGFTPYPSASTSAAYWAAQHGCSTTATNAGNFEFDWFILFNGTTRWVYVCESSYFAHYRTVNRT